MRIRWTPSASPCSTRPGFVLPNPLHTEAHRQPDRIGHRRHPVRFPRHRSPDRAASAAVEPLRVLWDTPLCAIVLGTRLMVRARVVMTSVLPVSCSRLTRTVSRDKHQGDENACRSPQADGIHQAQRLLRCRSGLDSTKTELRVSAAKMPEKSLASGLLPCDVRITRAKHRRLGRNRDEVRCGRGGRHGGFPLHWWMAGCVDEVVVVVTEVGNGAECEAGVDLTWQDVHVDVGRSPGDRTRARRLRRLGPRGEEVS